MCFNWYMDLPGSLWGTGIWYMTQWTWLLAKWVEFMEASQDLCMEFPSTAWTTMSSGLFTEVQYFVRWSWISMHKIKHSRCSTRHRIWGWVPSGIRRESVELCTCVCIRFGVVCFILESVFSTSARFVDTPQRISCAWRHLVCWLAALRIGELTFMM